MRIEVLAVVSLTAALHFYIAWFEIFAWTTKGPSIFETLPSDLFPQTVEMAANQGVYNAFLGAGLCWALLIRDVTWQRKIAICFLRFVLIAGLFAAATVALKPGLVQILPSGLGLGLFFFAAKANRNI